MNIRAGRNPGPYCGWSRRTQPRSGVFGQALRIALSAIACCCLLTSATEAAQPKKIIYETDMCLDVDDVGGLAMLHALANQGEAEILAVTFNEVHPHGAAAIDAINTWYGRGDLPVGIYKGTLAAPDTSRYLEPVGKFPHDLTRETAPTALEVYRKVLAAQPDQSVTIISVGFLNNLHDLLQAEPELVKRKVKEMVVMGGRNNDGFNLSRHELVAQTEYVIRNWPTPLVISQHGGGTKTGAKLADSPAGNPVRAGYYQHFEKSYQNRSSWDQVAVLYGVRGLGGYFNEVTTGTGRLRNGFEWQMQPGHRSYLEARLSDQEFAAIIEPLMIQAPQARRAAKAANALQVLCFNGDTGFVHDSKPLAEKMIVELGRDHGWKVTTTSDPAVFTESDLSQFDVIVFANNCGTAAPIFNPAQQAAFQKYVRAGGGFVGIHCAGAIWHETGEFKEWYERLIGTRLVAHPAVQPARLTIENRNHISTLHLPVHWEVTDEWHRFNYNPRTNVNVLISLDESSYHGKDKMFGDHPVSWFQQYDGGRSFFTTLGHTTEIYGDPDYRNHVLGGIQWAAGAAEDFNFEPITKSLMVDLNADRDVAIESGDRVGKWLNQVASSPVREFVKQDEGRDVKGSGRPRLKLAVPEIRSHNTLVFHRQELVNHDEDAFDHLLTGAGYTWFTILAAYTQVPGLKDVNSFFGNLRNSAEYEGIWGCLTDDNRPWMGSRSGKTFGRFDENNPMILADTPLAENRYYLVMGRMGAGTGEVPIELFVNDASEPVASGRFPVNPAGNSSKMAIGQERDATNHPGRESFDGEIARFLIYDRPLTDAELVTMARKLKMDYAIGE